MSDKRYEANIIRTTAVEPANNLESTSAPGVWSIDEVVELQKKNKWPTVGNVATDVTDVFSTFVYDGNGEAQVIENGIALGNAGDGGSGDFSASATSRVNVATSANFDYGTGDYTIEAFIFIETSKNFSNIYDQRTTSQNYTTNSPVLYVNSSNEIIFMIAGSNQITSSALSDGVWYHVALTRASGSTKLFVDGTQSGSTYSDSLTYVQPASDFSFGGSVEQNQYNFSGFISNLRVVKGTALYTSNFTAPTAALTAVSGTSLLTLQGSTPFVDNSGNSVTLTQNGSPKASEFGPFTGSSGEGGLVWFKQRNSSRDHGLFDTARGTGKYLVANDTAVEATSSTMLNGFNSNGFTLSGGGGIVNNGIGEYTSWTFRKAPKFFDIVTWSGTGSSRTISHNLGSVPGMIIIKCTSHTGNWSVWHRSVTSPNSNWWRNYGILQSTMAWADWGNDTGLSSEPTSTAFSLGSGLNDINASGRTYVAYLFAHNNNDGEFGPDQDADIIKCGSYTTDSNEDATIDLGFEPQFVMFKRTDSSTGGDWNVYDAMRGMQGDFLSQAALLEWNTSDAEDATTNRIAVTPTGFKVDNYGASRSYIYMAIRRGPLAQPTSATDVFAITTQGAVDNIDPGFKTSFPVDFAFRKDTDGSNGITGSRLTGLGKMYLDGNNAEVTNDADMVWDFNNGWWGGSSTDSTKYAWMWKRAPSYFDVVTYTGTGSARTISHNLGVAPEMIWLKSRDSTENWQVGADALTGTWTRILYLNLTSAESAENAVWWNNTAPTSSVFSIGTQDMNNKSGDDYIAYLFATVAGVSKVGSYTGTGSAQNIDCGFSSGAKFVIIKRTDSADDWLVFDTTRGIVSGNDPYLALNNSDQQITSQDYVDPYSSGFAVTGENPVGANGGTYLFYAIAT